jgi:hypothetical protein
MTLPHRTWTEFYVRTIERLSVNNTEGPEPTKWTTGHYEYSKIGNWTETANDHWSWKTILMPSTPGFELTESLNEVIDFGIKINASIDHDDCGPTNFHIMWEPLNCPLPAYQWDPETVTGRHYDGVNQWFNYPYYLGCTNGERFAFLASAYPLSEIYRWEASSRGGVGHNDGNDMQEEFFQNGLVFYLDIAGCGGGCSSPLGVGDELSGSIEPLELTVNYFNPIINTMSRRWMPEAGGVEIVFTGLGFDQDDNEICDNSRNSYNTVKAFESLVDFIDFIGRQGQGTTRLQRLLGDFIVNSDTKITIPSMPALPKGTYDVKFIKSNVLRINKDIEAYVGDFKTDPDPLSPTYGEVSEGDGRVTFLSSEPGELKPPMIFSSWEWKLGCVDEDDVANIITEYYAPIDVRSPSVFYEGRILSASGVTRSIDDFTGVYQISDMTVDLASADHHFQERLALGHCKNRPVSFSFGWTTEPTSWATSVFKGICDDYDLVGTQFQATVKDISQKYFRRLLPRYIATEDDYPNIHPDHVGRAIPEILGTHSWTGGENPGAIEAIYTDTTTFRYVASAGVLNSVTQVYSAGSLVNPANYAILTPGDGRTYIDFVNDQGDNKITFNCTGYSQAGWNSANGYVENPAYVLAYVMVYLLGVPLGNIDAVSLADIRDYFTDNGWDEIGRLAITDTMAASQVIRDLLFSFGVKMWTALDGNFKLGRKDLTDITADIRIFAQIDLIDDPVIQYNLRDAINHIKSKWDFYPAPSAWKYADEVESEGSEKCYDVPMEKPADWDYPWISSSDYAAVRINEDLQRLGYGNRKVNFKLPIEFITEIDIFDNFRLQDPLAVSVGGTGDPGRYYYVISLTYNFQDMTIDVIGADLQWLISQCFIIGDCDSIPNNWSDASDWQRMFGYIGDCDTDLLPGGDPLKKICKCE